MTSRDGRAASVEGTVGARRSPRLVLVAGVVGLLAAGGCTCGDGPDATGDAPDEADGAVEFDSFEDMSVEADESGEPEDGGGDEVTDDAVEALGPPRDIDCGNGVLDPGEECDDGNRLNGDDCDWLCSRGPGEDPPEPWPDPSVGRVVPETSPTAIDLGVENPNYDSGHDGAGSRPPLVSDGTSYATVWPHRASEADDSPLEGTFVRFDITGRRLDAPWTYRLGASHVTYFSTLLLDLAWSGSGYGLLWSGRETIPPGEGPGISFMALDVDGKPLAGPVSLSPNGEYQQRLGIAWDGDGYGCLGEMFEPADAWGSLGVLRVTPMGERRDDRRHALEGFFGPGQNAFAASGELYVAAWAGSLPPMGPTMATYGVAAADGTWYGAAHLGPVAERTSAVEPDVAWSGSEFGIAWLGPGVVEGLPGVWFARLSARGELLAPPRRVFYPVRTYPTIGLTFGHGTFAVGFLADDNKFHLVRLDRNGAVVEHVTSSPAATPLVGLAAVAADDLGFGILGATIAPGPRVAFGPPVFSWFRVVSP